MIQYEQYKNENKNKNKLDKKLWTEIVKVKRKKKQLIVLQLQV